MSACPHLGLNNDATIMLSEATLAHRCYATRPSTSPSIDHQGGYCLAATYAACPFYLASEKEGAGRAEPPRQPDAAAVEP